MSLDEMQARCDAAKYKPHSITFTDEVSCGAVDRMSGAIVYDERGTPMFIVPRKAGTSDDMLLQMLSRVVQNEADMPRLIAALRVLKETSENVGNELCEMFDDNRALQLGASLSVALARVTAILEGK